jgi:transposase
VTIVPDERAETFVRTFVDHFAAIGGVPLLAVFDRPRIVALKWTRDGHVTEWNPLFAGVALDLSVGIEVCWPASPWQKGSVENLVGWSKGRSSSNGVLSTTTICCGSSPSGAPR